MQTVSSGASRRLQMAMAGIPLKASLCTACQTQAIRAPFNLHNASIWANYGPRDQCSLQLFYKYVKACDSKCSLWISIPNIAWELSKNAELQALAHLTAQTLLIYTSMRSRMLHVHVHMRNVPENHLPSGPPMPWELPLFLHFSSLRVIYIGEFSY